jgi:hypothetical protein
MDDALDEVLALETAVWQALVDGNASADAHLLSEDFLGVYPTGLAGRDDHVRQLDGGPTVAAFELSDVRALEVGDDSVLIVYRAAYRRTGDAAEDDSPPEAMFVSSLWCRRGDRWVNVFSQDTPDSGIAVV